MKQEKNNEMDLLLRRLGRQQDVFAPDTEDHLDADELNAYAEDALPAKTRSRYTAHLAECARCRELVVQLSAAAGVVAAEQAYKVAEPSGLKKLLASLLSPMVLRYAAPALGLIVVAAIGFVVLRRDRTNEYVSQVQPAPTHSPNEKAFADSNQQQPQSGFLNNDSADKVSGDTKETKSKDSAAAGRASAPEGTPATREENEPAPPNTTVDKFSAGKPESQPAMPAAPASKTAKVDSETDEKRPKNEDAARKQEAEVTVAPKEIAKEDSEFNKSQKKKTEMPAVARSRAAKPAMTDLSAAQGAAPGSQREGAGRDDKDSSSETRSVAGRRFRKQRGVWTDTAYEGAKENMIVTRGSEGYRGLIADEPAIKTIADQLDGEIIVVWKGRIYRIR